MYLVNMHVSVIVYCAWDQVNVLFSVWWCWCTSTYGCLGNFWIEPDWEKKEMNNMGQERSTHLTFNFTRSIHEFQRVWKFLFWRLFLKLKYTRSSTSTSTQASSHHNHHSFLSSKEKNIFLSFLSFIFFSSSILFGRFERHRKSFLSFATAD